MESRIIVDGVWLTDNGQRINYSYRGVGKAEKYFARRSLLYVKYEVDLRGVPESILLIPLVANLAPIAWIGEVPLDVLELDSLFLVALDKVKSIFMRDYPSVEDGRSPIRVSKIVDTPTHGKKKAMLFSGGVDAYATFFRHHTEGLDLVSIHGADIPIKDKNQWQKFVAFTANEPLLAQHEKLHVEANLREFYTYQVNLLVPSKAWWGTVQHGLALNSLVAPLGNALGYSKVYIASSYTDAIQIVWGSTPEIDNSISWSGCVVDHDGYELQRIKKIGLIVSKTAKKLNKVNLRVCYSELNKELNCSNCEKCYRTMLGLSLYNADPANYGLKITEDTYFKIIELIQAGFKSSGSQYFWWELHERMKVVPVTGVHLLGSKNMYLKLQVVLCQELKLPIRSNGLGAMKLALIERFPRLFSVYLMIRRRFS
jgi:hypothetical protein